MLDILTVFMLASSPVVAPKLDTGVPEVRSYRAERYTAADGLDTESLIHVARLADGRVITVGVRGEPRVFDGHRFTAPWGEGDPEVAFDGGYATVQVGDDVWLSSQRTGLHRIRGSRVETIALPDQANPSLIALDHQRRRLLIPSNKGLMALDLAQSKPAPVRISNGFPCLSAAQRPDGSLFAGGAEGLVRIEDGIARPVLPWLTGVHIWSLSVDRRGRLLVATRGLGLVIISDDGVEQLSRKNGLPHDVIRAVAEVGDELWLATAGAGLVRLRADGRIETFSSAHGLSSDTVTWVSADERGVLWAATAGAGLNRLWPSPFTTYPDSEGRLGGFHYAAYRDSQGQIWIGSNQGLARLVDGTKVSAGAPGTGQAGTVLGVIEHGDSLLVSARRGLFLFHPERGFTAVEGERTWHSPVLFDSERWGALVGQVNQVYRMDGRIPKPLYANVENAPSTGPASDRTGSGSRTWPAGADLRTIAEDAELGLLFATMRGAWRSDGEHLWPLGPERPVSGFLRLDHRLLITGANLGVWANGEYFEAPVITDRGPSASLYSAWNDGRGGLWLLSREGLLRIATDDVRSLRPGTSVNAVVFGLSEGLPSTEFEAGHQTLLPQPDGTLLFASTGGLTRLDPRQVGAPGRSDEPTTPLSMALNSIESDEISHDPEPGLRLPPGTRRVALRFSALPAARSDAVQIRYRLHPVEHQFRSDMGQRQAIYGGLGPGSYRLEINGTIPGIDEEQASLSYPFSIEPRWLERRAVQVALALAALMLLALLPTLHIRSLRHQRRRLIAQVAERTADLERLARTDGLTGLLNRRSFDEAINEILKRPAPVGLILTDVDYFKKYNDHLGHQAGDHCLKTVASALSDAVSRFPESYPRLVARIGGEEFAVLCAADALSTLADRAESLRLAVAERGLPHPAAPMPHGPGDTSAVPVVSLSLGFTLLRAGDDVSKLLQRADAALYRAKSEGRNRAVAG